MQILKEAGDQKVKISFLITIIFKTQKLLKITKEKKIFIRNTSLVSKSDMEIIKNLQDQLGSKKFKKNF